MALRKSFKGVAIVSIFMIGMWLLGPVSQATAETLNFKMFNHATKVQVVPVPDVEGHAVIQGVREGVVVFENGEWAWVQAVLMFDLIKGVGAFDQYATYAFLDESTFTVRGKGKVEIGPQNTGSASWASEIIHGTGRFQGIKGTMTNSGKVLRPEKGEGAGKVFSEGTLVYTLPGK